MMASLLTEWVLLGLVLPILRKASAPFWSRVAGRDHGLLKRLTHEVHIFDCWTHTENSHSMMFPVALSLRVGLSLAEP